MVCDERDNSLRALEFVYSFSDNPCVMFCQPIFEEIIWNSNRNGFPPVLQKPSRFKPGVKAVSVYLGLDKGEDLRPDIP